MASNSVTGIHRAIRPHSYRDSSCKASKVTRMDSSAINKGILGELKTKIAVNYNNRSMHIISVSDFANF